MTSPLQNPSKPHILMSPPDYFTVDYAINPWMKKGSVDNDLARKQWDTLYDAITRQAGAEVHVLPPVKGLPDLVFTANAAFVYKDTAIIAHYRFPERQPEEPYCEQWFKDNGYRVITLPPDLYFEGAGDALIWQDRVFAGYKTRTDITSHALITEETGLPVLSLELIDPRFYHIDVCICPLYNGYFIYYPGAFDEYGLKVIEENIPAEKRIPVTDDEAARFACNAVNVNDTVIFNQGSNRLAGVLEEKGFRVIQVDLGEFLKSGGSSKCLTLRVGIAGMTRLEKRYKTALFFVLIGFCLLELPFSLMWLEEQGGMWGTHLDFWNAVFHDPLYQVTAIDFGTTAMLVFAWMAWDSKRRSHHWRAWLWLPVFLVIPTVGLIGYLLTRKGWEFPFPENDSV